MPFVAIYLDSWQTVEYKKEAPSPMMLWKYNQAPSSTWPMVACSPSFPALTSSHLFRPKRWQGGLSEKAQAVDDPAALETTKPLPMSLSQPFHVSSRFLPKHHQKHFAGHHHVSYSKFDAACWDDCAWTTLLLRDFPYQYLEKWWCLVE